MDPGPLFSSLLIGTIGFGMLIYGKKAGRMWWLLFGLLMCVFPYVVHSVGLMWAGAGGCIAGAVVLERFGG
jgi:hypothetical protein